MLEPFQQQVGVQVSKLLSLIDGIIHELIPSFLVENLLQLREFNAVVVKVDVVELQLHLFRLSAHRV